MSGSTAIAAGSTSFTGWATGCAVQRGYIDIADPTQGMVSAGTDNNATGPANQSIVSLGDSGIAILTFATPIFNGPGADFAVFENGFADPANPEDAFLELAFVEVSSDGVNYFRFPCHSLTPATPQVPGSGVYMDAGLVNNLAGKYISGYGTPFNLDDLADTQGLDLQHVTHIRIVDVVGAVNANTGTTDTAGNMVNDPYPTNFPTGGFDLDAVGVIHQYGLGIAGTSGEHATIYPNPATDRLYISGLQPGYLSLCDVTGKVLWCRQAEGDTSVALSAFPPGIYTLHLQGENGEKWVEKIVKQ